MKQHRRIEFQIPEMQSNENHIYVLGRCIEEPIKSGDMFTELFRLNFIKTGGITSATRVEGAEKPVSLKVVRIEAYRHDLDALDRGMTARVELTGIGFDILENIFENHKAEVEVGGFVLAADCQDEVSPAP